MALPTVTKTWVYDVNHQVIAQGSQTACYAKLWFDIMTSMIANGWTCVRSSNSSTVSNSNLWLTTANLVQSNNNGGRSWMILRNTNIGTNFEICFDWCNYDGGVGASRYALAFAPDGFTTNTGTVSATFQSAFSPITALGVGGQILLSQQAANRVWGDSNLAFVWHAMYSSDGQCTRILVYQNNALVNLWIFDKAANPSSGWTKNGVALALSQGSVGTCSTMANHYAAANVVGYGANANVAFYMGTEGYGTASLVGNQNAAHQLTGEFPITPISLITDTALNKGKLGTMQDLWFGVPANANGTAYPADTTRTHVQHGVLVMPWNGTLPLTA